MKDLKKAIAEGVLLESRAQGGMKAKDIENLHAKGFDDIQVLIRFSCTRMGDARTKMSVRDFHAACYFGATIKAEGKDFFISEIRDVTAPSD